MISDKCCKGAKKNVLKEALKKYNADLNIFGVRKAEGGARADSYGSCFSECKNKADEFRPVWWMSNSDRKEYEEIFGVEHSRCYTEYGLKRTGCVGCPFAGKNVFAELEIMKEKEPNLYKVAWAVFGKSYEYQKKYYEYREFRKTQEKELDGQLSFFD
jgi:3'-phosphoadenosine 5'-phosphosulfate sulfotransferase (PAPS reductase)/FAD synthetase